MKKAETANEALILESVPNVGKRIAEDLRQLGIERPEQLRGQDPYEMYDLLCAQTGLRHDPCLLDTFIAAVRFMDGGPASPWWAYTAERKATMASREDSELD